MLKRKTLILGFLCVLTLLLASCGGGGSSVTPDGMLQPETGSSPSPAGEQTQILPPSPEVTVPETSEEIIDSRDRSDLDNTNVETQSDISGQTSPASAQAGSFITLGSYEQDNDFSNGNEAIEWLVLDRQDDKLFVVSRYCIEYLQYSTEYPESGGITWETCTLRGWLNGDFLSAAFSEAERTRILSTTVSTMDNVVEKTKGGNDTVDLIFLLGAEEMKYFSSNVENRCPGPTEYIKEQSNSGMWWLRTPGRTQNYAAYVSPSPAFSQSSGVSPNGDGAKSFYAVRPAMWISAAE